MTLRLLCLVGALACASAAPWSPGWKDNKDNVETKVMKPKWSPKYFKKDKCGCSQMKAYSSYMNKCIKRAWTDQQEVQKCQGRKDFCGCWMGTGFSSEKMECMKGKYTNPMEQRKCKGKKDDCGCRYGKGWSSTENRCAPYSSTDHNEARKCRGLPDLCGCKKGAGYSSSTGFLLLLKPGCKKGSFTTIEESIKCRPQAFGCEAIEYVNGVCKLPRTIDWV